MNSSRKLINFRNRGGHSREFGVMHRLVGGDSQIHGISLLQIYCKFENKIT
jgi:hypothetical protein